MPVKLNLRRNAGHPWDGRPGFDLLFLDADTQAELDTAVERAEHKFWAGWLQGMNQESGNPGGVMYKPCGATEPWDDSPEEPHPGNPSA